MPLRKVRAHLLKELLHRLDHMLVELDRLDGSLGDGRHFGLGDGWLDIIER